MTDAPRKPDTPQQSPRVAVLMSRFPAVTETFILREMIEMERQGEPVRLVPMLKDSPAVIHEAARPWLTRALYTPFLSLPIALANLRALLSHPFRYLALLLRLAAGTITSFDTFSKTLLLFPKSVFIAAQLESEGVKHVHAHFATHPATMALIISQLSSLTFSITVHAHDIFVDRRLLRWKLREARFVRSISQFNKDFLERLYPRETPRLITVVHVGIEPDLYERTAREITPDRTQPPRLLCVAAHKPYKGLPALIAAAAFLRDEGVSFLCQVVGDGPMRPELEALIRQHHLESHLQLLGVRSQEQVTTMMSEATLFVLPSTVAADGQMEGIPVALMEAMASGRAVVTTATSGIPELVEDGVNGRLVPHDNPRALADAIRQLLADADGAAAMGRKGQEKVRREFELSSCVRALLELLQQERAA